MKRFLCVGCSHGDLADPKALAAVIDFKARWKPDFVAHLGDFIDMAAFRTGAKGNGDEAEPIEPDFQAGMDFLQELKPHIVICGNHEDRLWNLRSHPNAIVATLAARIVGNIQDTCKAIKAKLIPYDYKAHYRLGDFKLMHGKFYNEMALRDHAEAYGNCIIAHTHKAGLMRGRRDDNPVCIGVGTLTKVENMDYAKNRRATLGWSQGLAFGVYDDRRAYAWLCEKSQNQKNWVFPI